MAQAPRKKALEKLLDLCARSERVSDLAARRTTPGRSRSLGTHRKELVEEFRASVSETEELPKVLRDLGHRHGLDAREMILLLLLLNRRIEGEAEPIPARSLLAIFGGETSDLLRNSELLDDSGRLVRGGLVVREMSGPTAGLDGEYRVAEEVYLDVYRWYHALGDPLKDEDHRGAYSADHEHFVDCLRLVNLHQRRAAVLFPWSFWGEMHPEVAESAATLGAAARRLRQHITLREEATTAIELSLVGLRREYSLSEDEEVAVLALLVHELNGAPPLLEFPELLRLVAQDEGDLLRQRAHFAPGCPLREAGLLVLVSEYEEPDFIAEVFLASWVADRLLANIGDVATIDPEEQRRFHDYLERLDGSDDFYRNL